MTDGIYILANDIVFDQAIALLNSIEVNAGQDFPICIIPYDDRLDRLRQELQSRPNVEIFEDRTILNHWEEFVTEIWQSHPDAISLWKQKGIAGSNGIYRLGMHRRFCGFDGIFDRFIYLDADILILDKLHPFFDGLDEFDAVVYDYQYKDLAHVFRSTPKLEALFPGDRLQNIFCAGLYCSKKGLFDEAKKEWLLSRLKAGEAEILYPNAPDQTIINYMMMRSGLSVCNFTRHWPPGRATGCCVTSPHFEQRDNLVYDCGVRLTYLHYIGLSSGIFEQLCRGENIDFPYRETFLHYRYLHEPEKRPQFHGTPKPYNPPPSLTARLLRKFKLKK
jgi:hypothetical protein